MVTFRVSLVRPLASLGRGEADGRRGRTI